jgi:ribosomal-protein-alanine N-acetyltransferase
MALKDQIRLFFRWPVIKALPNRIRRILSVDSGLRTLKMPVLETERLVLRKLVQEDLRDINAWEEVTWAQNTGAAAQVFLDYCFREYRERGIGPWGIQLKETGAIVGNCGFPHIIFKKFSGEVNCYIASRHRGQGLACEALRALFLWGFREIGLTRIQARCEPDNLSSQRLAQKAGMKFEGWIETAPISKDPIPKQKFYAILAKDFNSAHQDMDKRAPNMTARTADRS